MKRAWRVAIESEIRGMGGGDASAHSDSLFRVERWYVRTKKSLY